MWHKMLGGPFLLLEIVESLCYGPSITDNPSITATQTLLIFPLLKLGYFDPLFYGHPPDKAFVFGPKGGINRGILLYTVLLLEIDRT